MGHRWLRLFARFDDIPLSEYGLGILGGRVCKYVGMAAHELINNALDDIVDGERALASPNRSMKNDLHEQVAELLAVIVGGSTIERLDDLERLFDEVGLKAVERLLAVPWAAIGGEQLVHDVDELSKACSGAGGWRRLAHALSIGDGLHVVLHHPIRMRVYGGL